MIEPVYLELNGPLLPTEFGKRWVDEKLTLISKLGSYLRDISKVAKLEREEWDPRMEKLWDAGIPLAASGFSQYYGHLVLDHFDGKTSTTMPGAIGLALAPATNPTATTTGTVDGSGQYTGYVRKTFTPSTDWVAATTATPSVVTNSASQIQWAGCSGGGSINENGVCVCDNQTLNLGNVIFWGTITPVAISPTQTPPTIAGNALQIQLNTT